VDEHVVGIKLEENEYIKRPPDDVPLPDGRLSCITCHDSRLQEYPNHKLQEQNPMFLRRAPYEEVLTFEWAKSEMDSRYRQTRYTICLYCHRKEPLLQFSPHKNQINKDGSVNAALCIFCHYEVPDRNAVAQSDWKLKGRLETQCIGCHMGKTRYHPIRVTHYGNEPPERIYNQIKFSERRVGVIIPLGVDAEGKERVVCVSCHNPHQRGVLKNILTQKGEDSHQRLRLDGFQMCLACHGQAVGVPAPGSPF